MFERLQTLWAWIAALPMWSRSFYDRTFWDGFFDGLHAQAFLFMASKPSRFGSDVLTPDSLWAEMNEAWTEMEEIWVDTVERFAGEHPDVFARAAAQKAYARAG